MLMCSHHLRNNFISTFPFMEITTTNLMLVAKGHHTGAGLLKLFQHFKYLLPGAASRYRLLFQRIHVKCFEEQQNYQRALFKTRWGSRGDTNQKQCQRQGLRLLVFLHLPCCKDIKPLPLRSSILKCNFQTETLPIFLFLSNIELYLILFRWLKARQGHLLYSDRRSRQRIQRRRKGRIIIQ